MSKLTHVHDFDELEAAITESGVQPVLLFKHSRTCGISHEALDELRAHLDRSPAACRVITVQSHRSISDHAATRFGIRHETPQVILLKNGRPVWNASHFRITAVALEQALNS